MSNKVIKSVSFNVTNPLDAQILKSLKRRNFSGYVKKLLAADLVAKDVWVVDDKETQQDIEKDPQVLPEKTASTKLAELKRGMSGPKLFH